MKTYSNLEMAAKAPDPVCLNCKSKQSLLWHAVENGKAHLCLECHKQRFQRVSESQEEEENKGKKPKQGMTSNGDGRTNSVETRGKPTPGLRKSTRSTRFKNTGKTNSLPTTPLRNTVSQRYTSISASASPIASNAHHAKASTAKGRNRRSIFKRAPPIKAVSTPPTTRCVDHVLHKGSYLQIGDIVSLVDDDYNVYYAQIRGLLVDSYCEKSAFLTWLIPTQESPDPREGFDAATYIIGHDEELSRKVTCMEFVMHAPSNYYLDRTTPFPLPTDKEEEQRRDSCWTSIPRMFRNRNTTSW